MAYSYTRNARKAGPGKALSANDLAQRRIAVNLATAATHDVLSGQGWLHKIVVNGGTMGAVTIYDEAGTATTNKVGTIGATGLIPGATFPYDCPLDRGLRITLAQNTDITAIISF